MARPNNNPGSNDGLSVPFRRVMVSYISLLLLTGAVVLVARKLSLSTDRALLFFIGLVLGAAAAQRPRWVYETIRNLSWYPLIPGVVLRGLFAALNIAAIGAALFLKE